MDRVKTTWLGDWRQRIRLLVNPHGCTTIADFLSRYPAEPYTKLAGRLGDDVAPIQLSWMQFEEAQEQDCVRGASMDCLARCLAGNVKRGWLNGRHFEFNAAGAYAFWVGEIKRVRPDLESTAWDVWRELKALNPPQGWLPGGPNDPLIRTAFDRGWPLQEVRQVQMASSQG
jgi:hypothetical protein